MAGHATVGVDDDLATGQAGVAHGAAQHERPRRVDQQPDVGGVELREVRVGQHGVDDMAAQVGGEQVVQVDVRGVLRGDDDGVEANRSVTVVLDGYLGLAVGPQVGKHSGLADLREAAGEPVRQGDRKRHQFRGIGASVAEHQALVAGTLKGHLVVGQRAGTCFVGDVDAARNFRRLCTDRDIDAARVSVEPFGGRVVSDFEDTVAHDLGDVRVGGGRDFTDDVDLPGGDQGFHRHARARIRGEQRVEDGVADRVTDLVRVSFCHGLTGEKPTAGLAHRTPSRLLDVALNRTWWNTNAADRNTSDPVPTLLLPARRREC